MYGVEKQTTQMINPNIIWARGDILWGVYCLGKFSNSNVPQKVHFFIILHIFHTLFLVDTAQFLVPVISAKICCSWTEIEDFVPCLISPSGAWQGYYICMYVCISRCI